VGFKLNPKLYQQSNVIEDCQQSLFESAKNMKAWILKDYSWDPRSFYREGSGSSGGDENYILLEVHVLLNQIFTNRVFNNLRRQSNLIFYIGPYVY